VVLKTENPQRPDAPEKDKDQQRTQHFNVKIREHQSSKIRKMRAKQKERMKKLKDQERVGHRSKTHEERIRRAKGKDINQRPRFSVQNDSEAWRWRLFKVIIFFIAFGAFGALVYIFVSGGLFRQKGKILPTTRFDSYPGWINRKKNKFKRHQI